MVVPAASGTVPRILKKFARGKPEFVCVVVLHLPAEKWFQDLETMSAHWIRLPGRENDFVDAFGDSVGKFCFVDGAAFHGR